MPVGKHMSLYSFKRNHINTLTLICEMFRVFCSGFRLLLVEVQFLS